LSNFDSSLISAVRRGELDFESLVEVLSKAGYLTDIDSNQGLGLASTRIEGARQEDFDALFQFFYLGVGSTPTPNIEQCIMCQGALIGVQLQLRFFELNASKVCKRQISQLRHS
jgi:hypothetical protein